MPKKKKKYQDEIEKTLQELKKELREKEKLLETTSIQASLIEEQIRAHTLELLQVSSEYDLSAGKVYCKVAETDNHHHGQFILIVHATTPNIHYIEIDCWWGCKATPSYQESAVKLKTVKAFTEMLYNLNYKLDRSNTLAQYQEDVFNHVSKA